MESSRWGCVGVLLCWNTAEALLKGSLEWGSGISALLLRGLIANCRFRAAVERAGDELVFISLDEGKPARGSASWSHPSHCPATAMPL